MAAADALEAADDDVPAVGAQPTEWPLLPAPRLSPLPVPPGFRGDRVAVLGRDAWLAAGFGELLRVSGDRLARRPIPTSAGEGHRLVVPLGAEPPPGVRLGTVEVPFDPGTEVRDLLALPPAPPCGGWAIDLAVFSPDGSRAAAIRRELPTGCLLPDGSHPPSRPLATELLLLDGRTGALLASRDAQPLESADLSERHLVLVTHDRLLVFDARDLAPLADRPAPVGPLARPRFSPRGELLAVASATGRVALLDTVEWAVVARWEAAANAGGLAFHPRLPILALGAHDGSIQLWALDRSVPRLLAATPAETGLYPRIAVDLAFSPDGDLLLAARGGDDAGAFTLAWDPVPAASPDRWAQVAGRIRRDARGRPLPPEASARFGDPGVGDGERIGDLVFDGDSLRLLDRQGAVSVWPERRRRAWDPEAPAWEHLALAPDGTFFARAERDRTRVEVISVADRTVRARIDLGQRIQALRVVPDGVAAGGYGIAGLWSPDGVERRLHRHPTTVTAVDVSSDGRVFASCDIDGLALVSRLDDDAPPRRLRDDDFARDARLSADGSRLVVVHSRSTLRVWDPVAGRPLASLKTGIEALERLDLSPDGRRAAAAGRGLALLDLERGEVEARVDFELGADRVRFAPDGSRLVIASPYSGPRMYAVPGLEPLPTAPGHTAAVVLLRVAADGDAIFSADADGNLIRWSMATGEGEFLGPADAERLADLPGDAAELSEAEWRPLSFLDGAVARCAARFPDGGRWAVGYDDRTVLVVDAPDEPAEARSPRLPE